MNSLQRPPLPMFTPVQALWRWLMARPGSMPCMDRPLNRSHAGVVPVERPQADKARSVATVATRRHLHVNAARPMQPLRVLQVVEAGQNAGYGARLRISGRMADVCAELDRLAAHEALLH